MARVQNPRARRAVQSAAGAPAFRLTYATMFDPSETVHQRYEKALAQVKARLGQAYGMFINGQDRFSEETFEDRSPINTRWLLGTFPKGGRAEAGEALSAAEAAFPKWAGLKWPARVRLLRKAAAQIEKRLFEMAVAGSLEVGKNRMEALGDVQETADLITYACDQMEANDGYLKPMGVDPIRGYQVANVSVLRPYGPWVVISPWNFPVALAGGPAGAALVAGNTVVLKTATDTPWVGRLLAECFRDAGLPDGVFNFVTGPGATLGRALIDDSRTAGVTFTGSFEVGMDLLQTLGRGRWPRPGLAEMGGKNACIVSRQADLDAAATGIVRSAYGLQGQKCSATSRLLVQRAVKDKLLEKILAQIEAIRIGDPTERDNWMGPVANAAQYRDFDAYCEELSWAGEILYGGYKLIGTTQEGFDYGLGYFCEPTLVAGVPPDHRLWQHEMFAPILMVEGFDDLEQAFDRANDVAYGLTAGFYGSLKEAERFFDRIEAGVVYANRPQGATTGAWPGFQPFGGWKGSGSTGKNAGGLYYLPLYMREQSRTLVKKRVSR
jgi:1-pyrroline-5-carboxylate dehydrogenase